MSGADEEREHAELIAALDAEGQLEREVLAEVRAMEDAPGEEQVRKTVVALHRENARPTRRLAPILTLVAAVAALLLAVVYFRPDDATPDGGGSGGPRLLGGPIDDALTPHGSTQSNWDGVFRWPAALSDEEVYRVRVYTWVDEARGALLVEEVVEYTESWEPKESERTAMLAAQEIEWEVVGLDAEERPLSGRQRSSWVSFSAD